MSVSREEAEEAIERLMGLADEADEAGAVREFDGQDCNDVRTVAARLRMLEGMYTNGTITLGAVNLPPGEYTLVPVVK